MRSCGRCGTEVSETAKFCEQCGIKLSDLEAQETQPSSVEPVNAPDVVTSVDEPEQGSETGNSVEELDLTKLDEAAKDQTQNTTVDENIPQSPDTGGKNASLTESETKPDNDKKIIDLKEILESEEKVEMDNKIRRKVLDDDEVFYKVCPMCGEELSINKKLLENTPVMVKCLKCGHDTKIW